MKNTARIRQILIQVQNMKDELDTKMEDENRDNQYVLEDHMTRLDDLISNLENDLKFITD